MYKTFMTTYFQIAIEPFSVRFGSEANHPSWVSLKDVIPLPTEGGGGGRASNLSSIRHTPPKAHACPPMHDLTHPAHAEDLHPAPGGPRARPHVQGAPGRHPQQPEQGGLRRAGQADGGLLGVGRQRGGQGRAVRAGQEDPGRDPLQVCSLTTHLRCMQVLLGS